MKRTNKTYRSQCPINFAQEIFGDKWSLLIIRDLMFFGKKYYVELLRSDEKISTNILADRLSKLEADGLITKTVDEGNLSKFVYALSQKGLNLMPMLLEMIAWSGRYDAKTEAPAEFVARIIEDRSGLIEELTANVGEKLKPH